MFLYSMHFSKIYFDFDNILILLYSYRHSKSKLVHIKTFLFLNEDLNNIPRAGPLDDAKALDKPM